MTQTGQTSLLAEFLVTRCRACGAPVNEVLTLGSSPLANALLADGSDHADIYPLGLSQCSGCGLIQNSVSLPTDLLFGNDYPYLSSVSQAVRDHSEDIANSIRSRLGSPAKALEVGSNDGTVQRALQNVGIQSFGVDPASIAVDLARERGCAAHCGPFDEIAVDIVKEEFGLVDIVHMSNVLAHVPDPLSILKNAIRSLKPEGIIMIEVQSWLALVGAGGFDMIYHEHHCHFDLGSLGKLCEQVGLGITEIEDLATQGGSIRVWCRPDAEHDVTILDRIRSERTEVECATSKLKKKVEYFRASVEDFKQATSGKTVWGYGAAAKTVTLLATCQGTIGIQAVVDASPTKIGRFLPLNGLPVVSPDDLNSAKPDVIVLFAWNLAKEIIPILGAAEILVPIPKLHRAT